MNAPVWLFIWIIFLVFAARRLILLLHVFQQEEYDAPRFLKWIVSSRSYDKRLSVNILLLVAVAYFIPRLGGWIAGPQGGHVRAHERHSCAQRP